MDDTTEKENFNLSLIKQEDVFAALREIDQKGIPKNAHSSKYDLIYKGRTYPPKLVLSWAYRYATGNELDRRSFEGGKNTPCFNCLQGLGFIIMPKNEYMELLYRKEVDYSMLLEGITVTNDIFPRFQEIYGEVEAGKQKKISVQIDQKIYSVEFRNINRKNASNVYQIRYPKKGKLSTHLIALFPEAYQSLKDLRMKVGQKKTYARLPEGKKEYLLIYYDLKNKRMIWQKQEQTESFYPVIRKFIEQADAAKSLKVNDYPKFFEGLEVKVSFGQGGYAHIPWISFLYEGQTTSKGIYPVFLYFKKQEKLILAYGISETNEPLLNWEVPLSTETIADYFDANGLAKPNRYGSSYIYQIYSLSTPIDQEQIDAALQDLITIYKNLMEKLLIGKQLINDLPDNPFDIKRVGEISQTGLLFNQDLMYRYVVSLLTKPFVILSGLSGSGKTKLALSFAKWLVGQDDQIKIVSVGADWNNREYLLGYPNTLESGKYIKPDNGVLDFIIRAANNKQLPYFLILDEMNLSYVERYFADFLSCMESREAITLHPGPNVWEDVPPTIKLPSNLYITGTINVDETTYMFSPKVLDRANVIEFRISQKDMEKYLGHCSPLQLDVVDRLGIDMQKDFVRKSESTKFDADKEINDILLTFFAELKKVGTEFGYRTAFEIYRYVAIVNNLGIDWELNKRMDIVIMQKLLPKLHGSRKKMQPVLNTLWILCQGAKKEQLGIDQENIDFEKQFIYPLSAAKIQQMYRNAQDNGFTSYAEA